MADNSEEMLAVWLREYAKLRMQILDSELKGNKDDDDSIDYPKLDLN
jgi:hypothetical protein